MAEPYDFRDPGRSTEEQEIERQLRPVVFSDFSGQDKVVNNLRVFVQAASMRGEALDHVLLHGPPGLGKTTLSHIISREMKVDMKMTSGPVLDAHLARKGRCAVYR
jgi:holliday junction DNA helicase RuvB